MTLKVSTPELHLLTVERLEDDTVPGQPRLHAILHRPTSPEYPDPEVSFLVAMGEPVVSDDPGIRIVTAVHLCDVNGREYKLTRVSGEDGEATSEEAMAAIDEAAILAEARREHAAFQEMSLDSLFGDGSLFRDGYARFSLAPHRRLSRKYQLGTNWHPPSADEGPRFAVIWFEQTGELVAVELEQESTAIVLPRAVERIETSGRYWLMGSCTLNEARALYARTAGCGSLSQWLEEASP